MNPSGRTNVPTVPTLGAWSGQAKLLKSFGVPTVPTVPTENSRTGIENRFLAELPRCAVAGYSRECPLESMYKSGHVGTG
jgi:hypothetical protein